jgi:oligopeptidase B
VIFKFVFLLAVAALVAGCDSNEENMSTLTPPVAKVDPKVLSIHGHDRIDDYYWIRDDERKDPEVLSLLEAENAYTQAMMAHTKPLQETLYQEISSRLIIEDSSVPVKRGNYYYHREFRSGGEHPVYLRREASNAQALIILDVNELAEGHEYFNVGNWVVNENDILAYAEDNVSRRIYTIRFKNLKTGMTLEDSIPNTSTSLAWANDGKTLFYVTRHEETMLPYRVYRHVLGTSNDEDVLVYEEQDHRFYTSVYSSRSQGFVIISSSSTDSSEIRLIDANSPTQPPSIFLAREEKLEYRIRHSKDTFFILTNWQAENFRVMQVSSQTLGDKSLWVEVVPHDADTLIQDIELFDDFLVIDERNKGLTNIRVINRLSKEERLIAFPDPTYTVHLHSNPEVSSTQVRYVYSSLTTPDSIFEYDLHTGTSSLLKRDKVLGGFDIANYRSERISITARDGSLVPVSLVYRADKRMKGMNPLYIYAYGSYGYSANPGFSAKRISLLDRGFVFAMVHVRGGEDKGRNWYEQGKLLNKKNTFWDFIDATDALVERGYGHSEKVFAMGGSAGGLLMGVVANEAPEKYLGVVAHVPFVDVVTTMLDESIPLTTGEFSEWGNPKDEKYYQYMLSYSPYDQVKIQDYPNIFVTTGLHDSQVQYFEPVKWVSKLRQLKQDDNRLLIDINMSTGHGGSSGRYERYRKDALEYAFILDTLSTGN